MYYRTVIYLSEANEVPISSHIWVGLSTFKENVYNLKKNMGSSEGGSFGPKRALKWDFSIFQSCITYPFILIL